MKVETGPESFLHFAYTKNKPVAAAAVRSRCPRRGSGRACDFAPLCATPRERRR